MAWNWLGAGTTPRSTYKSSLPFLPTISRNRQAEEFRENLQTGNAEYGSFWGIDFAQRSNPIRRQSDFVETSSRDWRGGAAWSRMRAGADEYLNDLHNTLQGSRARGGHGQGGRYHANCEICNPYLARPIFAGYEEDPLMRVHKVNMFNLGHSLTEPLLPPLPTAGLIYSYR